MVFESAFNGIRRSMLRVVRVTGKLHWGWVMAIVLVAARGVALAEDAPPKVDMGIPPGY